MRSMGGCLLLGGFSPVEIEMIILPSTVCTKKYLLALALAGVTCWTPNSYAREDVKDFPVDAVLTSADGKATLDGSVKFAFGSKSLGSVARNHGEYHTNKKTNAFGKSDEKACNWAFLSAMASLQQRALAEGGNAVINIRSNYKNHETSSDTTFQCGAGNVVAGVALIGDVVTLK